MVALLAVLVSSAIVVSSSAMEVAGVSSGFVRTVEGSAPSILDQVSVGVIHLLVRQARCRYFY